jgi:hypothetical protein
MSLIPTPSPFDILANFYATKVKHPSIDESTKIYDSLRIHANGEYPKDLIDNLRPSESREIKEYRKSTYQAHTKPIVTKIISSLYKIRRSQDWSIKYENEVMNKIGTIPVGEDLQNYCENRFPYFGSVTDWMFNVGIKNYLIDPNGLVAIMPLNTDAPSTEMYKPCPFIYNSNQIVDFVMDEYAVVKSSDTMPYQMGQITKPGDVYYIFDKTQIVRYREIFSETENKVVLIKDMEFIHNMGELPVFQFQGLFNKAMDKHFVFESRISGIIPRLNEFATMWSDFKAEVVQHVHSTRWVMATQDCTQCNGTGNIIDYMNNAGTVICPTCKGKQKVFTSPYENLVVVTPTNANAGENPLPSGAPAGYIQKDGVAEMTNTLNNIIKEQAYYALSAINMEFLAEAPLSQSGIAKEVDRDELNNFVHAIAEDIVRIMDDIYYFVNEFRNSFIVPNPQLRQELLPEIAVPEKYDLLSTRSSLDELKVARDSSVNSIIITQMELDIARKRFGSDEDVAEELVCILNLDPFPGKSMDEITAGLTNGGITKSDFVIWCNLNQFVKSAIAENEEFTDLPLIEQKAIISKMASDMLATSAYNVNPAPYLANVPKEENEPEDTGRPLS